MAKANKNPAAAAAVEAAKSAISQGEPAPGLEAVPVGKTELNPAIPSDKQIADAEKAKVKADAKAAADAEKAKVKAERDAKAAEKQKEKEEKAKLKAEAKAEREARLAELAKDKTYHGSMLALADKVKSGEYVKGLNGQLRSNNDLAQALDGVSPTDVIRIGLDLLKLEENPYHNLNVGQQSMNLRNRLRGAIKKETVKLEDVASYIERNKIHRVTAAELAQAKADREAKAAERKAAEAEKKAKAAEAAKTPAPAEATA